MRAKLIVLWGKILMLALRLDYKTRDLRRWFWIGLASYSASVAKYARKKALGDEIQTNPNEPVFHRGSWHQR